VSISVAFARTADPDAGDQRLDTATQCLVVFKLHIVALTKNRPRGSPFSSHAPERSTLLIALDLWRLTLTGRTKQNVKKFVPPRHPNGGAGNDVPDFDVALYGRHRRLDDWCRLGVPHARRYPGTLGHTGIHKGRRFDSSE
jgi:hypothetical protein